LLPTRRAAVWVLAVAAPALIILALVPLCSSLGLAGALLCALVARSAYRPGQAMVGAMARPECCPCAQLDATSAPGEPSAASVLPRRCGSASAARYA